MENKRLTRRERRIKKEGLQRQVTDLTNKRDSLLKERGVTLDEFESDTKESNVSEILTSLRNKSNNVSEDVVRSDTKSISKLGADIVNPETQTFNISEYRKESEARRKELKSRAKEVRNRINASYDGGVEDKKNDQKNSVGNFRSKLSRIGGYLGESASHVGALEKLEQEHISEIDAIEGRRDTALREARQAYEDNDFALAKEKFAQENQLKKNTEASKQKFFNRQIALNNEERKREDFETQKQQVAFAEEALIRGDLEGSLDFLQESVDIQFSDEELSIKTEQQKLELLKNISKERRAKLSAQLSNKAKKLKEKKEERLEIQKLVLNKNVPLSIKRQLLAGKEITLDKAVELVAPYYLDDGKDDTLDTRIPSSSSVERYLVSKYGESKYKKIGYVIGDSEAEVIEKENKFIESLQKKKDSTKKYIEREDFSNSLQEQIDDNEDGFFKRLFESDEDEVERKEILKKLEAQKVKYDEKTRLLKSNDKDYKKSGAKGSGGSVKILEGL